MYWLPPRHCCADCQVLQLSRLLHVLQPASHPAKILVPPCLCTKPLTALMHVSTQPGLSCASSTVLTQQGNGMQADL